MRRARADRTRAPPRADRARPPHTRWLDPAHPDPRARNLRELWLPALEWYYSERVRQLTICDGDQSRAKDASGAELTDEAVRAAADFANCSG